METVSFRIISGENRPIRGKIEVVLVWNARTYSTEKTPAIQSPPFGSWIHSVRLPGRGFPIFFHLQSFENRSFWTFSNNDFPSGKYELHRKAWSACPRSCRDKIGIFDHIINWLQVPMISRNSESQLWKRPTFKSVKTTPAIAPDMSVELSTSTVIFGPWVSIFKSVTVSSIALWSKASNPALHLNATQHRSIRKSIHIFQNMILPYFEISLEAGPLGRIGNPRLGFQRGFFPNPIHSFSTDHPFRSLTSDFAFMIWKRFASVRIKCSTDPWQPRLFDF